MANVRKFLGLSSANVYFVNPAPELELKAFNVNKTLDTIEENIRNGHYRSNWSFDFDMVQLFQMFRDGHTDYEVGGCCCVVMVKSDADWGALLDRLHPRVHVH